MKFEDYKEILKDVLKEDWNIETKCYATGQIGVLYGE